MNVSQPCTAKRNETNQEETRVNKLCENYDRLVRSHFSVVQTQILDPTWVIVILIQWETVYRTPGWRLQKKRSFSMLLIGLELRPPM